MSARLSTALAARLLRRHVGGGAEDHADLGHRAATVSVGEFVSGRGAVDGLRIERLREAEVEHLHRAVGARP